MSEAQSILELLEARRNVLLSGPPGTGKSRLLSKVSALFEGQLHPPTYNPAAPVPIPPTVNNRKVFRCVLHQSSKYRDFLTGIMPDVRTGKLPGSFRITEGILYRASEFAKQPGNAALLIIDEINRGPTVQVFGGAIVAIEADKRLDENSNATPATQFFDMIDPGTGDLIEYALPPRLYILGAMNQADVSVEPLDVAFLRRWAPFNLEPKSSVLRDHYEILANPTATLPGVPENVDDVVEAAIRAFDNINEKISLGRGPEFRIGHGVLMDNSRKPANLSDAMKYFSVAWRTIKNHIDEAFFGDVRGTAIVLNADRGIVGNPYYLEETTFGDAPRALIRGPAVVNETQIYGLFLAMAQKDA